MKLKTRDIAIFAMLGAFMFASKKLMEAVPEVHLLGMFIVSITAVYRAYALIPIYVYVFLDGLFGGFGTWWVPYLYIWAVLWAFAMLIPKKAPEKLKNVLYIAVCSLHGFAFGLLYAPFEALLHTRSFDGIVAWWITGFFSTDIRHGISNLICGFLIIPMIRILNKVRPTDR